MLDQGVNQTYTIPHLYDDAFDWVLHSPTPVVRIVETEMVRIEVRMGYTTSSGLTFRSLLGPQYE